MKINFKKKWKSEWRVEIEVSEKFVSWSSRWRRKGEKIKAHSFSPFFFFLLLSLSKNKASSLSLSKYSNNTHIHSLLLPFIYHEIPIPFSLSSLSLSLHFPCSSCLLQQTHFWVLTTHIANTQRVCF
jgi:hypothetical protein